MTRPPFIIFPALLLVASLCPAQNAVEVLAEEIRRTEAERDRARMEFLELQSESGEALKDLQQREAELTQKLEASGRRMRELESSSDMSRAALERAEAEVREREAAIQDLRTQQLEAQQRYADLLNRLNRAPEGNPRLEEERDALRADLAAKEQALSDLSAARDAALSDLEEMSNLNDHLRNELRSARRGESLANAKLAALESRLKNLQEELARQYEERSELEQDKQRLEAEVGDLQSKLAEAEANRVPKAEFEALREELAAAESRNRQLAEDLAAREAVPDLREDLAKTRHERDVLSATQKTVIGKLERTEEELKTETIRRKAYERQNKLLIDELAAESTRRKELEKQTESLAEELDRARETWVDPSELAAVEAVLADMRSENENLKTVMENQKSTVDVLNRELNREQAERREEIGNLQTALREQMASYNQAARRIEELEATSATLDAVRAQRAELEARQDKARGDMKVLAEHIYDLRRQVREGEDDRLQARAVRERNLELQAEMEKTERLNQALAEENERWNRRIAEMRQELESRDRERRRLERELEEARRNGGASTER